MSFKDFNITTSKIQQYGPPVKEIWILEGLDNKEDFDVLKDKARLSVQTQCEDGTMASLKFILEDFQEECIQHLALAVVLQTAEPQNLVKQKSNLLCSIQIEKLDIVRDLQPIEILLPATRFSLPMQVPILVKPDLILLAEVENKVRYPMPTKLALGFTIQILHCNLTTTSSRGGVPHPLLETGKSSNLAENFKQLCYREDNYSDLQIETKDQMILSAHKFILAARSQVFKDLLKERMVQTGSDGLLTLRDVDSKPLSIVLHWMYADEILDEVVEEAEAVLNVAMTYGLVDMLADIENKFISICNQENMFNLLHLSKKNGMGKATQEILHYVKECG